MSTLKDDPTHIVRWSDQDLTLRSVMRSMKTLPENFAVAIGEQVNQHIIANKLLPSNDKLKSFGFEKVVMLMRSKAMRRWYDRLPEVHRAFNNLIMLETSDRTHVVYRIKISVDITGNYLRLCTQYERLPELKEVNQLLLNVFIPEIDQLQNMVRSGAAIDVDPSAPMLLRFHTETPEAPVTKGPSSPKTPKSEDTAHVFDESQGMRVRMD